MIYRCICRKFQSNVLIRNTSISDFEFSSITLNLMSFLMREIFEIFQLLESVGIFSHILQIRLGISCKSRDSRAVTWVRQWELVLQLWASCKLELSNETINKHVLINKRKTPWALLSYREVAGFEIKTKIFRSLFLKNLRIKIKIKCDRLF